jgi:hypothetical protein
MRKTAKQTLKCSFLKKDVKNMPLDEGEWNKIEQNKVLLLLLSVLRENGRL